jgi:hypothetical protein
MVGIARAARRGRSVCVRVRAPTWAAVTLCIAAALTRHGAAEPGPEMAVEAVAAPSPVASASPPGTIGPVEIQCGAARGSSLGNLLDSKRAAVTTPRHAIHAKAAKQAHIRRIVLALAAEEARNQDAGTALELYWSLAEAQTALPEIDAATAALDEALADRATLAARGVDLPLDEAALQGRRLVIEDARITVVATIDSLSTVLAQLAGLPGMPIHAAHPASGRAAVGAPLDADALVAEGLVRRPQLRMLRAMLAHLDDDTAEVGSTVLSLVTPGLGGGCQPCQRCPKLTALVQSCRRCSETASIGRQVRELLAEREAAVEAEIRRATTLTVAAADRVATAERQLRLAERSAADKRSRQAVAEADAFEIRLADLEVTAARRSVLERLAGWERARAKIWLAQGVLATACGCGR